MKHFISRHLGRSSTIVASSLLLLALSPVAIAEGREGAPTVLYRLAGPSSFLSGCIDGPCLCPVRLTYLAGTFGLTPAGTEGEFRRYEISDVDWFTHFNGAVWSQLSGSGRYLFDEETHRIVLDLQIDGADPITVDSGVVPRGVPLPAIDITALTDGFCYQEGVDLTAAPTAARIDLAMVHPTTVAWSVAPPAEAYDLVAGDLLKLRASGGDFTISTTACVGNDVVGTTLEVPDPVASGQAIWFLARGVPEPGFDSDGFGQADPRDWEITTAPASCP
jgi:hypothetical protein